MAKNNNRPRDDSNALPIMAAHIFANAFEVLMPAEHRAMGNDVRNIGIANKAHWIAFESAIAWYIEARSSLSPALKTLAVQIVDHIFDRAKESDYEREAILKAINEGGSKILSLVKLNVGKVTSDKKASMFHKFEAELDDEDESEEV